MTVCRDPGCGRPKSATSPFCRGCERWIWLAVLIELLEHPPPGLALLGLLVEELRTERPAA